MNKIVSPVSNFSRMSIFLSLHLISTLFFGYVCHKVYEYNTTLLLGGTVLWITLLLTIGSIIAVTVMTAFLALLIRPYRVLLIYLIIPSLCFNIFLGFSIISLFLGLFYFGMSALYSFFVMKKLENQITVSLDPFREQQSLIFWIFTLFLSVSMSLGYHDAALQNHFAVPTAYKESTISFLKSQMESTLSKGGFIETQQAIIKKATEELEKIWSETEAKLDSYSEYISVGLGALLFLLLRVLVTFFSWVPFLVFNGIVYLLKKFHVLILSVENKEVQRLIL